MDGVAEARCAVSLPIREGVHLFLHKDTIEYLNYLARKWGAKSKSDVLEELVRRSWKAEHRARMKKLASGKEAA